MGSFVQRLARQLLTAFVIAAIAALFPDSPARALDPARSIAQLHHSRWSLRDGVPADVSTVAQTPDGFLWIGGPSGLYRFDGVRAEPFAVGQIPGESVISLVTSEDGDLWAGLRARKIARIRHGDVTVFEAPKTSFTSGVLYLAPDPDGTLWVGTQDTVYNFDGQNWRVIASPWPPSAAYSDPGGVWGLAVAQDGTVWAKNLLGLYYLRRGAAAFEAAPGYAGSMIDFVRDREGRLWTADSASFRFYALPVLSAGQPVPQPQFGAPLPPGVLGSVRMDRDGSLWNPNRVTGGLQRFGSMTMPTTVEQFIPEGGRPSGVFSSMLEDREGNIWVTSPHGLDRFRHANIVTEPEVAVRTQAPEILATKDAVFVFSGMGAPVYDPAGVGRRLYRIRPGEKPELIAPNIGQVEAMAATPDGNLIFAAEGELQMWSQGTITPISMHPDINGAHVNNIVALASGEIWVSVHGKGVFRLTTGKWTRIALPAASLIDSPELALDATGAVWLFYPDESVMRIDGEQTTEYHSVVSEIGYVQAIMSDRDGVILVGLRGLAHFDGHAFRFLSSSRAPVLASLFGIAEAADDSVWLGTASGIVRIARPILMKAFAEPQAPLDFQLFEAADGYAGMPPSDVFDNSLVAGPDGKIWFLMNDGLAWIDPSHLYRNVEPPPVVITSVTANGQNYNMPEGVTLPPGTSQLEIDYTGLSLAVPERVRFRYKLTGVDKEWIDPGVRRQAFYTNVEPGEYSFQVIAANNDGVWNEQGATLRVTIEPTFLQSIWFKLLIGLGVAGLAWLAYSIRLKQQAARLQGRFNVRIAERERIARELHDTLLQGFQGLLLRFQSVANRTPVGSEIRTSLDEALDRADAVLVDGRARVRGLRTTATEGDLAKAIIECAHNAIAGDNPQFRITVEGSSRALHALVAEEATRIAEEAIRNAVRHADAKAIEVTLSYGAGVGLIVRDDGIGMPQSILSKGEKAGHFGLIGMRERAQRIGARLDVTSREGAGTEIILTIPGRAAYMDRSSRFLLKLWPVGRRHSA
jgi:signal transduction histidine kinase/ligand-binding sensor domain-containing protein